MTTTVLDSTTLVSTFICSLEVNFPASFAFARMRWTAFMTSDSWARKAFPNSEVHLMFSICLTTSGSCRRCHALYAVWDPVLLLLHCVGRGLVFKPLFFSSHCWSCTISQGYVQTLPHLSQQSGRDEARLAPPDCQVGRRIGSRWCSAAGSAAGVDAALLRHERTSPGTTRHNIIMPTSRTHSLRGPNITPALTGGQPTALRTRANPYSVVC